MASTIQERPDDSETPCPWCQQGTGYLRSVRSDGALKILGYVCQTCEHRWQASERWMDEWSLAAAEPPVILDESQRLTAGLPAGTSKGTKH